MKKLLLLFVCLGAGFLLLKSPLLNPLFLRYNGKINLKGGEEIKNQAVDLTITPLAGYTNKISVFQGEKLSFHVSAKPEADFSIFVYREGGQRILKGTYKNLHATTQNYITPEYGFDWPANLTIDVPQEWESGFYYAQLVAGNPANPPVFNIYSEVIPFIVKEDNPGSTSRILFQLPTNTWLAYNNRLGRDFYTEPRTFKSSFKRPIRTLPNIVAWIWGTNESTVAQKEVYYIRWLEQNGYKLEFSGNQDIEDYNFLHQYNFFISAGHDEYWSKGMRDNLEQFIKDGGNALFASSNSVYYQVRYEDNYDTVTTYKIIDFAKESDPMINIDSSKVAIFWSEPPVSKPENSLTGVGYRYGGIGKGGYAVYRTNLWPFTGTSLYNGAKIGENLGIPDSENRLQQDDILAKEVDATSWQWGTGGPVPKDISKSGTPANFQILGINSNSLSAPAIMGMYEVPNGGIVFSFGTWDWWKGLFVKDAKIVKITKNIVEKLKNANITRRGLFDITADRTDTQSYEAIEDTYLDSANSGQNFGNTDRLKLGNNQTAPTLVKFNLESFPKDNQIQYAQLKLYPLQLENGSEIKATLFEPSANWKENEATWQKATSSTNWPNGEQKTGPFLESEIIYQTGQPINFDVTDLVKKWIQDPTTNFGVLLNGYTQYYGNYSTTNLYFASSENTNQAQKPTLIIAYKGGLKPPTPTPTDSISPSPTPTQELTPTPTPITYEIKVRAKGYVKNFIYWPKMRLYVNYNEGNTQPLTEWTTNWDYQEFKYSFTTEPKQIDLVFFNRNYPEDAASGATRALYMSTVNFNNNTIFSASPTGVTCFFDSGSEDRVFDGKTTYQSCVFEQQVWSNGSYRFTNLPVSK